MIDPMRMVSSLCLFLCLGPSVFAQLAELTDAGAPRFTDKIVGKWEAAKVVAAGRSATTNYGPSTFTANTWTIQTGNGDRVYELVAFKDKSDPLEAKFVDIERRHLSFEAFIRLEDDRLTIVRAISYAKEVPLPVNMNEGPQTTVYSFKKLDPKAPPKPTDDLRLPLNIRLLDTSKDSKVLVDVTVKPFYGGKLEYSTEKIVNKLGNDRSPNTGTLITGKVEEGFGGKWSVNIIIEVGADKSPGDPDTQVIRSEKLQVVTVIAPDKTYRIKCDDDRTCELTFK